MLAAYLLSTKRCYVILDRCIKRLGHPKNTLGKEGCAHSTDVSSTAKSSFCRSLFNKHITRIPRTPATKNGLCQEIGIVAFRPLKTKNHGRVCNERKQQNTDERILETRLRHFFNHALKRFTVLTVQASVSATFQETCSCRN